MSFFQEILDDAPQGKPDKHGCATYSEVKVCAYIRRGLKHILKERGFRLDAVGLEEYGFRIEGQLVVSAPYDLLNIPPESRIGEQAMFDYIEGPNEHQLTELIWDKLKGVISYYDLDSWDGQYGGTDRISFDFRFLL